MDRYRRSERDRDDPNIQWMGGGESYRPGGGSSAPPYRAPDRQMGDSWSAARRDDRRDERREEIDSYVPSTSTRAQGLRSRSPGAFRRRSRSPAAREDTYTGRARSPPPRRFSPRRDERLRSPFRRRSRSPIGSRPRSPIDSKRPRDYSPGPRRSSPPPKRERLASPPRGNRYAGQRSPRRAYSPPRDLGPKGGYRPKSRTPPRRAFDENWKRRSPSLRSSRPESNNTSRLSSPPVHPDRASLAGSLGPRSPGYAPSRNQYDSRPAPSPSYRARSPPRSDTMSAKQSYTDRSREPSPPRSVYKTVEPSAPVQPPSGPGGYRNGGNYDRPPPTGPSRGFNQTSQASPPSGPGMSMSAHNRPSAPSAMLSAPTHPRGAPPGRFDGPQRDFTAPAAPRGRGAGMTFRGGPPRAASYHTVESPPPGPRAGGYGRGDHGGYDNYHRPGPGRGGAEGSFPFRNNTNSSSSTTYPRTQRFNTVRNHLVTTEKIVPGGKLLPSGLPAEQERKMKTLEAEAERLRVEIEEKQRLKREALTDWESRERESEREALRSELAEDHLQKLTEGDVLGGAAF